MRRIMTQEERAKKTRLNQLIIGIVLIGLMVFSTLGYSLKGEDKETEKIKYKGIEFEKDNSGYWNFNIQGYAFVTKYNPQEVEDIYFFNTLTLQNYVNEPLYFVGDFQEPVYELSRNLNNFVLRFNNACLNGMNCPGDYPIKNCSEDNVIIIEEVKYEIEEGSISQEENSVYITASLGNQTRYIDSFLFDLLGIK